MKVLLLTCEDELASYQEYYLGLHKQLGSMDTRRLSTSQERNLKQYFIENIDQSKLDRIIFNLEFEVLQPQLRFLKSVENMVFLFRAEGLLYQKNKTKQQLRFFRKLPWSKIIVNSFQTMKMLQNYGLDTWCVANGFNSQKDISNSSISDNMGVGLLEPSSRYSSHDITELKNLIENKFNGLQVYSRQLLEIKSQAPQAGLMISIEKNIYSNSVYHAMASGCLVFSRCLGDYDENFYLSLKDRENIILYSDFDQLCELIRFYQANSYEREEIAKKGSALAMTHHKNINLGYQTGKYIETGMRKKSDYSVGVSVFGLHF